MKAPLHQQDCCPMCRSESGELYYEDAKRHYLRCCSCQLVYVPSLYWLSAADEQAIYDLHENEEHDPGYRRFLSRLTKPLLEKLSPNQQGLDFGSGPGPALSVMLEEQGHQVELYDPFYANNPSVLNNTYDFICATEVVEHVRDPDQVFTTLFTLLKPGGWLGIMTKMVREQQAFSNWHYIRDMTHICFYHRSTFDYLAKRFNAKVITIGQDVVLFQTQE